MQSLSALILPLIITLASVVVLLVVLFFATGFFVKRNAVMPFVFQKVVLLITVPKETLADKNKSEDSPQSMQEQVAQADNFFSAIGGLKAQSGFKAMLYGRYDNISFEIVAHRGQISFYVAVPKYLQRYLEQQLQARFPHAHIEEVEDYNIFEKNSFTVGAFLKFNRPFYFPIKTYKKMESDPLDGITNALSKLEEGESAAVQIVVRSAKAAWHKKGARVAQEMQQGK